MRFCTTMAQVGCLAAFAGSAPVWAGPTLIGEGMHGFSSGGYVITDSVHFRYGVSEEAPEPLGSAFILFDLPVVDASMIGVPIVANAANTPDWDAAVELLTNGKSNWMYRYVQFTGATGYIQSWKPEEVVFFSPDISQGPDFAGYEIHSIELTFVGFEFDSPGQDLIGDGIWTDWSNVELLISVYGTPVPAPAAVMPMFLLAGFGRRRARE